MIVNFYVLSSSIFQSDQKMSTQPRFCSCQPYEMQILADSQCQCLLAYNISSGIKLNYSATNSLWQDIALC